MNKQFEEINELIENFYKQANDLIKKHKPKEDVLIGKFGKFWDDNKNYYVYGFLKSVDYNKIRPFQVVGGLGCKNFQPLTDKEIDKLKGGL